MQLRMVASNNGMLSNQDESTFIDEPAMSTDGTQRILQVSSPKIDTDNHNIEYESIKSKDKKKHKKRKSKRHSKGRHKMKYRVDKPRYHDDAKYDADIADNNNGKALNKFFPGILIGTFIGSAVTNFILEGLK
ncbi:uncharacterized protein KLLA0_E19317g [Kluyveromyces lactis]|uniref:KLLA0E19317p n=1 Tax=Kluyveromyces lactis (strain ATCC 8585 / CBS 2359 / DSM 70799 / NBRC 1267 / NRRL Y-1140 / WM37) TaxID=284590 RepID=Q6CML4_KLULA|nr:uncharacterized protein KLLA0_E19317g [Kluyveromyces lactis]CAG99912.1 KLLA0E19317p [Kluyveromyces lactis]|eukprot:XP_454825.1 uncharacterized protein KLLA0_E19317g [Kluyveromyces lactis]